ncbi:MAG: alpha-galactosidase [Mitsuokella sp.]
MGIQYDAKHQVFHLCNDRISYLLAVLRNGQLGQLYFGSRLPAAGEMPKGHDYTYLFEGVKRATSSYVYEGDFTFSLEHVRQEYPAYGTTDYRMPAFEIRQEDGSRITDFVYASHEIMDGKPKLQGLPATYAERADEAQTLAITLRDEKIDAELVLSYTIFRDFDAIARHACFQNNGSADLDITRAMSLSIDLPDADYEMLQLSGWWARERHLVTRPLAPGIQSVGSLRGHSGHVHNPLLILKRPHTDESQGEAIGFSLVYSGNFLAQAEVDTMDVTRVSMGIHPHAFDWCLARGERFQTPEAVMVYAAGGLNAMSQTFHALYRTRLARGTWRDKVRPILINNWEATYFDFDEDKLLKIARTAHDAGVELFVLDDGWFGARCSDTSGLGDWQPNTDRLPNGIKGLSEKIHALGMKFGLWVELEMANKDSDLYRAHPDWILHVDGRRESHGRNQYVLDFSRKEVVDCIHDSIAKVLRASSVDYIKWDMNRSITECGSKGFPAKRQGEIFHRYILGVYDLYERLRTEFPHILFESCASGGGRFDPGMLYYAPQAWTSDDTDAVERLSIQYGTSYAYPIVSMGSHVSAVPNHQVFRETSLKMRGDVAYFGTFGYELDLGTLSAEELAEVRRQIAFMKEHRELIQHGTFYRLKSPFAGNVTAWMVVSADKKEALVGCYKVLNSTCSPFQRLRLQGLDARADYAVKIDGRMDFGDYTGAELMRAGLVTSDFSAGEAPREEGKHCTDYWSRLYVLKAKG